MGHWGIHDYQPAWVWTLSDLQTRLRGIVPIVIGHSIARVWTLWDDEANAWFNDAPVVVELDHANLEVCMTQIEGVSVTLGTIDISKPVYWCSDVGEDGARPLRWTDHVHSCLEGVAHRKIEGIYIGEHQLVEGLRQFLNRNWVTSSIGLALTGSYFQISNGLDCNELGRERYVGEGFRYSEVVAG